MFRLFIIICCASLLLAAGCKHSKRDAVWSSYDYLTPVSPNSGISISPSNRSIPYSPYTRQVYDNDSTYVIPYGSGLCAADDNLQECY